MVMFVEEAKAATNRGTGSAEEILKPSGRRLDNQRPPAELGGMSKAPRRSRGWWIIVSTTACAGPARPGNIGFGAVIGHLVPDRDTRLE